MKLAFCFFKYFPYGGLQRDFLRIAQECQRRGHEITVYTMSWEGEKESGFKLHLISAQGWQGHSRCASYVKQVALHLAGKQYDLVIGFNKMPHLDIYYAADVCYQARVRQQRSLLYRLLPRYRTFVALEQAVFAQDAKTKIMLVSAQQEIEFTRCYGMAANRFHLLPPGISKDRIAPANADVIRQRVRKENRIREENIFLLAIGSGFITKGLDRTLAGISFLPKTIRDRCRLFVIGQDNAKPFIKMAQFFGIANQVEFLGGRPDVPDFLLAADFLLHPAYYESAGMVLLEAMVAGLPVLTVDTCGYAHYVQEAYAGQVLSSPFVQTKFNQALEAMIVSPERETWRRNGLAFAKRADIYSLPEKAADFIEQVGRAHANLSSS